MEELTQKLDRQKYQVIFYPNGEVYVESAESNSDYHGGSVQLHNAYAPLNHYPDAIEGASVYTDAENSKKAVYMAKTILGNYLNNTRYRPSQGLLEHFAPTALKAWGYENCSVQS